MVNEVRGWISDNLKKTVVGATVFIAGVLSIVVSSLTIKDRLAFGDTPPAHLMGWAGPDEAKAAWDKIKAGYPKFKISNAQEGSEGKVVKLWDAAKKVNKGQHLPTFHQLIGDCVGAGHKQALDYLQCAAISADKNAEFKPIYEPYHYSCGRVLVGKGQIRGPDGSVGAWQVEALKTYGALAADADRGDGATLPEYSEETIRSWAMKAPAAGWIKLGKDNLLGTAAQVTTYAEARDAIANGYPVTVCSNRGFQMQPRVSGGKHWGVPAGQWNHCMCFVGVDDTVTCPSFAGGGKGALYILNSWGPDAHGKPADDGPPGGFWVSSKVAGPMLSQEDSFALSDLVGFPAKDPDWNFSLIRPRRPARFGVEISRAAMFAVGL